MKKNKIRIIFSVVIFLALGGMAFAFWASGIFVNSDEETVNIDVGVAEKVNTIVTINDDNGLYNGLVPIGATLNSEGAVVEYMLIPLSLSWQEKDNTDWAEGLKGIFVVEPSISLDPNNAELVMHILAAESLINTYFFHASNEDVANVRNSLDAIVANNPARTLNDFAEALLGVVPDAVNAKFEVELTLGAAGENILWLIVFIEMPCGETFPYINGGTIYINSAISHIDHYVENKLPTPIFNIGDLISQDDGNKLILGDDKKLFAQPYLGVNNFLNYDFECLYWKGTFNAIEVQISAATSIVSMWGQYIQQSPGLSGQDSVMISPLDYKLLTRFIGQVDQFAMGYNSSLNNFSYMPLRITAARGIELVNAPGIPAGTEWSFQFVLILTDSEHDGHTGDG